MELLEVNSMGMIELANKMENIFNISASFWNNLEDNYQKNKKGLA